MSNKIHCWGVRNCGVLKGLLGYSSDYVGDLKAYVFKPFIYIKQDEEEEGKDG